MKVLFVIPPYRTTDVLVANLYPMPLAATSLAAVMQQAGHQVVIKDFLIPPAVSKAQAPASFIGKWAPAYQHHGMELPEVYKWLDANLPGFDAVGLFMGQCNLWETSHHIGRYIKTKHPGMPLVIGGAFATTATKQAMELAQADVAVVGEGENVILQAFEWALAGKQLWTPGTPIENLDDLPLPAWELAPPANYPKGSNNLVRGVLAISRGCPHHCAFCSVHTVMGRKHRRLGLPRIEQHIQALYAQGVRYFCFLDDNLFINEAETLALCDLLNRLKATWADGDRVQFYVEEGIEVRVAAVPGVMQAIRAVGFTNIALGVETMNNARLKDTGKPYNQDQLQAAIENCQQAGVVPKAFYIVGMPGDTVHSVVEDFVQFGKLGMAVRPNNLKLYPGTDITKWYLEQGFIDDAYDWRLSSFYTPDTNTITYSQIRHLKAVLGSIGMAAETWGVKLFGDDVPSIYDKINATGKFTIYQDQSSISLSGNMFRSTPYRHALEIILLRQGALGASTVAGKNSITATRLQQPKDEIQQALGIILGNIITSLLPGKHAAFVKPNWIVGNSEHLDAGKYCWETEPYFDFIIACPPYHDLEKYTDNPEDLSNMAWDAFVQSYKRIIANCAALLKPNRFAAIVIANIRDKQGLYEDLVGLTIQAFAEVGMGFYNDCVLITPVGSLPLRAQIHFNTSRKLGKAHQQVLVFVKGDAKIAVDDINKAGVVHGQE